MGEDFSIHVLQPPRTSMTCLKHFTSTQASMAPNDTYTKAMLVCSMRKSLPCTRMIRTIDGFFLLSEENPQCGSLRRTLLLAMSYKNSASVREGE